MSEKEIEERRKAAERPYMPRSGIIPPTIPPSKTIPIRGDQPPYVIESPPDDFIVNVIVIAATNLAQQLYANPMPCRMVTVYADLANVGLVYVGGRGVSIANGFPLVAGAAKDIRIKDASKLSIIGTLADTVRVGLEV